MFINSEILIKLLLAVVVGGLVGAEREYRSKSAGFRTLTLICLGATLFTIFSQLIGIKGAPERIASNIVVGIGFVGAGVIFKGDTKVNGITTAAMIWVTAALGMGIGAGYELISVVACMLVLVMLYIFTFLEKYIDRVSKIRDYKITCSYENETLQRFEKLFTFHHLEFRKSKEVKSTNMITGEWTLKGTEENHRNLVNAIINDDSVKGFEV